MIRAIYKETLRFLYNESSVLIFIDLEPRANWSHECVYILYNDKEVKQIEAGFPPQAQQILLLRKPRNIEDWMLLTNEEKKPNKVPVFNVLSESIPA